MKLSFESDAESQSKINSICEGLSEYMNRYVVGSTNSIKLGVYEYDIFTDVKYKVKVSIEIFITSKKKRGAGGHI